MEIFHARVGFEGGWGPAHRQMLQNKQKNASGTPAQVPPRPRSRRTRTKLKRSGAAGMRGNGCETASSQKYNCGKAAKRRCVRRSRVAWQIRVGAESASGKFPAKFPSSQRRSTRADQMAEGGQEVSKNLAIELVLKTPQHRD